MKIAPSLLSCDFAKMGEEIEKMDKCGADYMHLDVMDAHFVPNLTFGAPVIKAVRSYTEKPFDVHLMISEPLKYIDDFAKAGADILTFHYECGCDVQKTIDLIKSFGKKAGLSIKPKTSAEVVLPYLKDLDLLLVMTVEPGFGGQKFMQDCAEKIPMIKTNAPESLVIQVDGGINAETARICTSYGANSLVAGNYIYKSNDIGFAIKSLR